MTGPQVRAVAESDPQVCVGVIVGAHGVRGAVRIRAFTENPKDVAAYGPVGDGKGRSFRLKVQGQAKESVVIAVVDGVTDRNQAEALKGMKLHVARDALPALQDEDEFYHTDLIGLVVETGSGERLGTVRAIHDFGAGDVLELVDPVGRGRFLPFTKAVVPVVDVRGGRLIADPPAETEAKPDGTEEDDGDEQHG